MQNVIVRQKALGGGGGGKKRRYYGLSVVVFVFCHMQIVRRVFCNRYKMRFENIVEIYILKDRKVSLVIMLSIRATARTGGLILIKFGMYL